MSRRNEGPSPYQGILVVNKPTGWTSFDVLAKLRGVLGLSLIHISEPTRP